jgi:hypothetical protein
MRLLTLSLIGCFWGEDEQPTPEPGCGPTELAWREHQDAEASLEDLTQALSEGRRLLAVTQAEAIRASSGAHGDLRDLRQASADVQIEALDALAWSSGHVGGLGGWSSGELELELADLRAESLGVEGLDLGSVSSARAALDPLELAVDELEDRAADYSWTRHALREELADLEPRAEACGLVEPEPPCEDDLAESHTVEDELEAIQAEALRSSVGEGLAMIAEASAHTRGVEDVLVRIRELATVSSSETMDDDERAYLQDSFHDLSAAVDQLAAQGAIHGLAVCDGSNTLADVQVGPSSRSFDRQSVALPDLRATVLGVDTGTLDLSTTATAQSALSSLDEALDTVRRLDAGLDAEAAALEVQLQAL